MGGSDLLAELEISATDLLNNGKKPLIMKDVYGGKSGSEPLLYLEPMWYNLIRMPHPNDTRRIVYHREQRRVMEHIEHQRSLSEAPKPDDEFLYVVQVHGARGLEDHDAAGCVVTLDVAGNSYETQSSYFESQVDARGEGGITDEPL